MSDITTINFADMDAKQLQGFWGQWGQGRFSTKDAAIFLDCHLDGKPARDAMDTLAAWAIAAACVAVQKGDSVYRKHCAQYREELPEALQPYVPQL